MNKFIAVLALGQAQDYTALAISEVVGETKDNRQYHITGLQRFSLGTSYASIVEKVAELMNTEPLHENTDLVADATVVGGPVVDLLEEKGLYPIAVTITGSDTVIGNDRDGYHVPKLELVSNLQILLQLGRLKIAQELPDAKTVAEELPGFGSEIATKAWREGVHGDLVLAVALACWHGQTRNETELSFRRIA